VIRWDYGRPYLIQQRDGTCAHNDAQRGCEVYAQRPAACRAYDCRGDHRVWIDYERRIPAPIEALAQEAPALELRALVERAAARRVALAVEASAVRDDE
jgi:hypothetical protein